MYSSATASFPERRFRELTPGGGEIRDGLAGPVNAAFLRAFR
jgi:hypothetical protein